MSTDELRICARRVLIAWDGTVLPKSRDSLMQERMEDLWVALDFEEPSPSKKLLDAGFTPRDRKETCDECGKAISPQMMPLHECATIIACSEVDLEGNPIRARDIDWVDIADLPVGTKLYADATRCKMISPGAK